MDGEKQKKRYVERRRTNVAKLDETSLAEFIDGVAGGFDLHKEPHKVHGLGPEERSHGVVCFLSEGLACGRAAAKTRERGRKK